MRAKDEGVGGVDTSTAEIVTMENTSHGGVMTLLRMARTRCGASLAFAALRNVDGRFAIAAFPPLTDDGTWTIESIEELAHHTWEDPSLLGGPVLVRTTRLLAPTWGADDQQAKLAAVPLSDPATPDVPWGLLCVAEPLKGYFEHDELEALSALAVRLTSYLRARQELFDGDDDEPAIVADPPGNGHPTTNGHTNGHAGVHGGAPPAGQAPSLRSEAATALDAALSPDPETGLRGIPSLLAHLGRMLADARPGRSVGVLMVELVPVAPVETVSVTVLAAAAAALGAQVRGDDLVTRLGRRTFAVAVELRGPSEPVAVRQRIVDTLSAAISSLPLSPTIRSALAVADESSGAEEVLRRAAGLLAD
jgi:GGDEF domain-containing protein